jgi:hypothetical protein
VGFRVVWTVEEDLAPTGFDPRTCRTSSESLYRAIPARLFFHFIELKVSVFLSGWRYLYSCKTNWNSDIESAFGTVEAFVIARLSAQIS